MTTIRVGERVAPASDTRGWSRPQAPVSSTGRWFAAISQLNVVVKEYGRKLLEEIFAKAGAEGAIANIPYFSPFILVLILEMCDLIIGIKMKS